MHMEFYQLKITRKGTKPPIWRRCLVPANITFAQMAVVLEEILEYETSSSYEFEFFQKKVQVREWTEGGKTVTGWQYDFMSAADTFVNDLMDTEKWFTFRVHADEKLPEYRADIEKKAVSAKLTEDDREVLFPVILKEVSRSDEAIWTDAKEKNAYLEETCRLQNGESDYRDFREIKSDTESKKFLTVSDSPVSQDVHNKQSANTIMKEFADKYLNPFIEEKMAELDLEEEGSRNPDVKEYLFSYTKEDLEEKAKEFNLTCDGTSKEAFVETISSYVLSPEGMREIFLQADEWEADAFEEILDKKCFLATEEDWIKLGWLSDAGYVVSYSDHHAEVPKTVVSLYKEINTPEFHKLCRQVSWMRSCQTMLGFIYAIAPLKIVYRMYRRRPEYKVSYEEFLEILKQVPENDNMCIVRDDKMILKTVLQDNLYERIEEYQGDRDFYMPSPEEVLDYVKHGYPSENPSYKKLENFLREELHQNEVQIVELMYIVFKEFSMDGMLSDIMEEFNNRNIAFDSDKQAEEFASIMMNVNNNTRMLDFRGYTPNEVARMSGENNVGMPKIVPISSTAANVLATAQPQLTNAGIQVDLNANAAFVPSNAGTKKIYPNDPCPCGSGKKYKKCCGRK